MDTTADAKVAHYLKDPMNLTVALCGARLQGKVSYLPKCPACVSLKGAVR